MTRRHPTSTLFPYTTLFRSHRLVKEALDTSTAGVKPGVNGRELYEGVCEIFHGAGYKTQLHKEPGEVRSEEHTSELQSHSDLVCRLLLEKKKPPGAQTRIAN